PTGLRASAVAKGCGAAPAERRAHRRSAARQLGIETTEISRDVQRGNPEIVQGEAVAARQVMPDAKISIEVPVRRVDELERICPEDSARLRFAIGDARAQGDVAGVVQPPEVARIEFGRLDHQGAGPPQPVAAANLAEACGGLRAVQRSSGWIPPN